MVDEGSVENCSLNLSGTFPLNSSLTSEHFIGVENILHVLVIDTLCSSEL